MAKRPKRRRRVENEGTVDIAIERARRKQPLRPHILCVGADGATSRIDVDMSLGAINEAVGVWVKYQRSLGGHPIKQGRPRGYIGVGMNEKAARILAVLRDGKNVSPSKLLRQCGRAGDYKWLKRQCELGNANPGSEYESLSRMATDELFRRLKRALGPDLRYRET